MSKKNIQRKQKKAAVEELPDDWTMCQLGDVMRLKNGYAFKSKDYRPEGIPLVRISDIHDGKVTLEKAEHIPEDKVNIDFIIQPGDLLIAMSGATTGKTGIYNGSQPCLQNQRVGNFKIISEYTVNKKYRNYYVASLRKEIEKAAYGGAQPNISAKGIEAFDFPLAPLNEQKRIVAEIEKQFSRLDEAVENLKHVKSNLKRYKASVLKTAVEGKLTEEWRKVNEDKIEPASLLIEKIKAEREKQYKEACEKAKKEGKAKPKKPMQLQPIDKKSLPELPEWWEWEQINEITTVLGDGLHGTPIYSDEGDYYFINGNNLSDGKIEIKGNTKRVTIEEYKKYKKPLSKNTVLVSINGTLGNTAFYNEEKVILGKSACYFNVVNTINKHYIRYCITSPHFINYANKNATGSTIKNVSLKAMREFEIPIPTTIEEQQAIVSEIESRLSVADNLEKEIEVNLKRADRLRQSVFKNAFSGKLVSENK